MPTLYRNFSWWRIFFLLMCGSLSFEAHAQEKNKAKPIPPVQSFRAEIEGDSFENEHWVQPLPDSTLLVISTKRSTWFKKSEFTLTQYNQRLEQVWSTRHEHQTGSTIYQVAWDRKQIFLLFSTRDPKKLLLYQVNPAVGSTTVTEHKLPASFIEIREMKALEGQVFLYGLEYQKLNMLHLNPAEEEIRLLPAVFGMEEDLGEFRVDTLTKAIEFVVGETNGWRSRIQSKRMNAQGDVIGTYFLQPRDLDNNLQIARLSPGDTLSKILIGTYGYRTTIFSKGLFTGNLNGNLHYYEFSQLDHFFEYTTLRRQRKLREKFARQEAQGKPLILRYRLLLHPIMPHPEGYALVGEIYYPQYNNHDYTTPGSPDFGNSLYARRASEGFRFTHAIACVFDHQGNLLWDNAFKLQNKTYPFLHPTLEAGVMPNGHIAMVYPEDEYLRYKTLTPKVSVSNDEKEAVRLKEETEKLTSSSDEGITHWYGGNFVAFGFQRIRPETGPSRSVFYLQKVVFE